MGRHQQLVKKDAERVDVGAGVDVERGDAGGSGPYSGVPMTMPCCVYIVRSVSFWPVALATPKSITFTRGTSSSKATKTFEGLMSRWMIPF